MGRARAGISQAMNDRRLGPQYRIDRFAQSIGPQRAVDAFGLRHPAINAGSFVVLTIAAVAGISLTVHSWPIGIPCGVAVGVLLVLSTRRNHRRRLANGTSAEYGAPS